MSEFVKWKKPSQALEVLKSVGVKATYLPAYLPGEFPELVIRGQLHSMALGTFGYIEVYQDNVNISFRDFDKSLRIINEDTGKRLYLYFPKKSEAGYYRDHLWVIPA